MAWEKTVSVDELPSDTKKAVKIGTTTLLLVNHQGQIYAVDNRCPHLKLSMGKGKVTPDGAIVCPWHKSAFELSTGKVTHWTPWPPVVGKAMAMVSSAKDLPTYPTKVEDGQILVEL